MPSYHGTISPLAAIEEIVVRFFWQRGKINKPLTCSEGLSFINSLIIGLEIEVVKDFRISGTFYRVRAVVNLILSICLGLGTQLLSYVYPCI